MSESIKGGIIAALAEPNSRQATKNRKWITKQMKDEREHEMSIALLNAFAKDPELKYYVGMAAGAGVAWVGTLIGNSTATSATAATSSSPSVVEEVVDKQLPPWAWILGPVGGFAVGQLAGFNETFASPQAQAVADIGSGGGLMDNVGGILKLGGTGFAGTCAMILILKAIFSGTDLGELLSGVGEVVPL